MVDPCKIIGQKLVKDIWKGVKRLKKEEVNNLVDRLRGRANVIKARNPDMTTEQASDQASAEMKRDVQEETEKRKQQVLLQENINSNNAEFAKRFKNESTGRLYKVRGGEGQVKGSQDSLNFQMQTEGARFLSHKDGLLDQLRQKGLYKKWTDHSMENQYNIARAGWGQEVEDPDHKAIADIANNNAEWRRKVTNIHGGNIRKLPNRLTRSIHNPFMMRRMADSWGQNQKMILKTVFNEEARRDAAFEHWAADAEKHLILRDTFSEVAPSPENFRKALRKFWEENDTGLHSYNQDLSAATGFNLQKGFALAAKTEKHRVFHYKSPESQVDYLNKYGGMSLQEAIGQDIFRASRDIAMLKTLGPNGINEMDAAMENAVRNERTKGAKDRLAEWKRLKSVLEGSTSTVQNYTVAKVFSNVRRATSYARLGMAALHAQSDLVHEVRTLEFNGMNPLQAHAEVIKNVHDSLPGISSKERRAEMDRIAYCGRNVMGQMASRFSIAELPTRIMRKLDVLWYRLIGLTAWDKVRTGETTGSLVRLLGQNRNVRYEALHPQMKHSLMLSNITEKEWDAVRSHPQTGFDKKKIICADIGRTIPDNEILDYLGKTKAPQDEIERAKTRIEDLFANYFYNQEMHVVPLPTLREEARITMGLPRGSLSRELWGNFWQFKSFPLSFMRRIYGREVSSGVHGPIFSNIDATKGSIFALTQLAVEISLVNVTTNSALALAQGKSIPDYTKPYNIFMALLPLSGLFRDLFSPHFATFGHGVGELMAGAPGGWANDIVREARTLFSNPLKAGVQFAQHDMPGANHFLLKPILHNFVLNYLAEKASPGINRKAERRLFKRTGQTSNYQWLS